MNKQQLIEYLDAVCDAESAVQACNDAIEDYEQQMKRMPPILCPQRPTYQTPTLHTEMTWNWETIRSSLTLSAILVIPVGLLLGLLSVSLGLIPNSAEAANNLWLPAIILSFIGVPIYFSWADKRDVNQKNSIEKEAALSANQKAEAYYQQQLSAYQKQTTLNEATLSMLAIGIKKQENLRDNAQDQLTKLYSINVIYPSFQNLIAAYQIREYLKMGICDALEGPTGAYAQYMEDVRTARICNSIIDLKNSLTSAIHGLQGTLARELRQVDDNLTALRSEMGSSMNSLTTQMQQMHAATAAQLETHFNEANRHLTRMGENIAISAHNQYIEQRLRNVDAYLLKMPNAH